MAMLDLVGSSTKFRALLKATGAVKPYQKEFFQKDGSRLPVLVGCALFEGGHEGVAFVLDLSEQKRAEEKIREQEMEFRQMLELGPQQVAVFGPGGERLYANRIALDYVGLSLEEWRQTSGNELRLRDSRNSRNTRDSRARGRKSIAVFFYFHKLGNGRSLAST